MSRSSLIAIALLQLTQIALPSASIAQAFIPTSVALEIAKKVAKDQGYSVTERRYFFDLLTTENHKPPIPGFIAIEFYGDSHPLLQIAISQETGQIVDTVSCTTFEYPNILPFQKEVQKETGLRPMPIEDLANRVGCPSLRPVSKPALGH